jgi:hypothetical protein
VFIVWASAAVGLGVMGLPAPAALSARRVRRRLAAFEAQGIRRRSAERPS